MSRQKKRSSSCAMRLGALLLACLVVTGTLTGQGRAAAADRELPLAGPIVRAFDPPQQRWGAGHRGVDIEGAEGDPVRAAASGAVSFVGTIAGITSVSVRHADGLRTTYQPLDPLVVEGQQVTVGQLIGRLAPGHCGARSCLHWGLADAGEYLDPLGWLAGARPTGRVRLLPVGTRVKAATRPVGAPDAVGTAQPSVAATAVRPVEGPLTSGFGSRVNPVLGTSELHDGLDFGAACGTPVRAAWSGVVSYAAPMSGFGNRVVVDHGTVAGAEMSSSYNHLSDAGLGLVQVGDTVSAGQVIALVGTTGLSTGCHLHFSVYRNNVAVDPQPWLG